MPKSITETPTTAHVITREWVNWDFHSDKSPFDEAIDDNDSVIEEELKIKQNSIEHYLRQRLLIRGGAKWSLTCVWSIRKTVPLVYNLKATIFQPDLSNPGFHLDSRGFITPPIPPQPPPPNL